MVQITKKELIYNFFEKNPEVIYSFRDAQYVELLGVKKSTYKRCKDEYKSIIEANKVSEINPRAYGKVFKSRPREKFLFDDSRL